QTALGRSHCERHQRRREQDMADALPRPALDPCEQNPTTPAPTTLSVALAFDYRKSCRSAASLALRRSSTAFGRIRAHGTHLAATALFSRTLGHCHSCGGRARCRFATHRPSY